MMVYALASRLDPNTRRLLQRIDEFAAVMGHFEKRMNAILARLEQEGDTPCRSSVHIQTSSQIQSDE